MTIEELHNAIRKRVREQVQEPNGITVLYDNQPEAKAPNDLSMFVMASIKLTLNSKQEVGRISSYRQSGVLMLLIFCESGRGDKAALQLASRIIPAFQTRTEDGIVYQTPQPENIGLNANKWWQINVNCPFFVDTTP